MAMPRSTPCITAAMTCLGSVPPSAASTIERTGEVTRMPSRTTTSVASLLRGSFEKPLVVGTVRRCHAQVKKYLTFHDINALAS